MIINELLTYDRKLALKVALKKNSGKEIFILIISITFAIPK
jgi:hypothetical protein